MIFCLITIIGWIIGGALWFVYRIGRPIAHVAPFIILWCIFLRFLVGEGMLF